MEIARQSHSRVFVKRTRLFCDTGHTRFPPIRRLTLSRVAWFIFRRRIIFSSTFCLQSKSDLFKHEGLRIADPEDRKAIPGKVCRILVWSGNNENRLYQQLWLAFSLLHRLQSPLSLALVCERNKTAHFSVSKQIKFIYNRNCFMVVWNGDQTSVWWNQTCSNMKVCESLTPKIVKQFLEKSVAFWLDLGTTRTAFTNNFDWLFHFFTGCRALFH